MRSVKFRAWDKDLRKIGAVLKLDFDHSEVRLQFTPTLVVPTRMSSVKLMQFTGLLDKNRKEIYEGDIVNTCEIERLDYSDNIPEDCHGRELRRDTREAVVIQIIEFGWWAGEDVHLSQFSRQDKDRWIEVIGNIYENPELLTSVDTLCPHDRAQDVACDECSRSGFRWEGFNA